ncbi:hypothetical protein HJG60_008518 [Phyllostomus discolor]|uniref:Uncharacterized protein n=1 Tax=Phyllostomus discolor TaxID=89673 RepID=A0A833YX09_9CHIR|nr:hypothetical protein HJG60_008518 [Phyllostomus discolor]
MVQAAPVEAVLPCGAWRSLTRPQLQALLTSVAGPRAPRLHRLVPPHVTVGSAGLSGPSCGGSVADHTGSGWLDPVQGRWRSQLAVTAGGHTWLCRRAGKRPPATFCKTLRKTCHQGKEPWLVSGWCPVPQVADHGAAQPPGLWGPIPTINR